MNLANPAVALSDRRAHSIYDHSVMHLVLLGWHRARSCARDRTHDLSDQDMQLMTRPYFKSTDRHGL